MATAEDRTRAATETRSVADLLKELRDETTSLFRQEVSLAKTEMTEKATRVGRNTAYLAVGGLVAYLGAAFALLAVMYLLMWWFESAGMMIEVAAWLAPLIVGIVVGVAGYAMIKKGLHTLKRESVVPEETVRSLQENKQWAQRKLS